MVFLDDLKDLVLYKKPFVLPINEKTIKKGSAIFLISPSFSASVKSIKSPYLVNKMDVFQSYYLEKNANYYINKEGFLQDIESTDEYLHEVGENDAMLTPAKKVEDYQGDLFFISDKYMDGAILNPRIPDNYFTQNGYEDITTPRVCFCSKVNNCLTALGQNVSGKEFYVYSPSTREGLEVWQPNEHSVPDFKATNEYWVLKPVQLKLVGRIRCTGSVGDGKRFTYGGDFAQTYDWNYKWLEKHGETISGVKPVQESVGPLEEKLFQDFKDYIKGKKKFENVHPLSSPIMHEAKKKKETWLLLATYSGKLNKQNTSQFLPQLQKNVKYNGAEVEFHTCYLPGDIFIFIKIPKEVKENAVLEAGINLAEYNHIPLTQSNLDKYKSQYSNLNHVRINKNTKGYLYIKDSKVVGMVNTESKDEEVWIQGLEVFGDNKGKHLGYYLLEAAVEDFHATKLSVRKTNSKAIKLYKEYGFETYKEDSYMYYMELKSSMNESYIFNEENIKDLQKYQDNFKKKKIDKDIKYISIKSPEAQPYLKKDKFCRSISKSFKDYNGEIAVDGDNMVGYVFIGDKVDKGFIHSLRVYPEYRGYGIGSKLLDIAINKYGGYDLTVAKDNELPIDIYKRKGFAIDNSRNAGKKMYYMVLKSHKKENAVQEAYALSSNDTVLNFDKWKKGSNNILYVTGLSGSGKTTLGEKYEKEYNAHLFEIDGLEFTYDSTNTGILEKIEEKCPEYASYHASRKTKEGYTGNNLVGILKKALSAALDIMKKDSNNLYIVEGVQIFQWLDPRIFSGKPVIIKGTSALRSAYQRYNRGKSTSDNSGDNILKLVSWYIKSEKSLSKFKKEIKESEELQEAARSELPESEFGVPGKRKFPLDTPERVKSAVRFFNYVEPEDEAELAKRIKEKAKKFGVAIRCGKKNRLSKYITKEYVNEFMAAGAIGNDAYAVINGSIKQAAYQNGYKYIEDDEYPYTKKCKVNKEIHKNTMMNNDFINKE